MRATARRKAFLLALVLAFTLAGCGANLQTTSPEQSTPVSDAVQSDPSERPEAAAEASASPAFPEEESTDIAPPNENGSADEALKKQLEEVGAKTQACIISISCATLLDRMDDLAPEKAELVPADGVLLPAVELTFTEGESAFDLLLRVCRENKLHMEFSETPLYGSAYIEGIGNLYEFDGGEGSGWMYRVNGEFPNVGCSQYTPENGDMVEWLYTCDFGADLGG